MTTIENDLQRVKRSFPSMGIKKERKLFVDDGRSHGTVILNLQSWNRTPEGEFTHMADAFLDLAKEKVSRLEGLGPHGFLAVMDDFHTYPIVFLYRHAIELYLKAIALVGSGMLALKDQPEIERQQLLKDHDLNKILEHVERVFAVYGWGWDLGNSNFRSVADLRKIIREFQQIDPGSHSFRYPVNKKGEASLEENFRFNVFEFASILDDLFPTLRCAVTAAHEEYQNQACALGEAQNYAIQNGDYQHEYDYCEPERF